MEGRRVKEGVDVGIAEFQHRRRPTQYRCLGLLSGRFVVHAMISQLMETQKGVTEPFRQ